MSRANLTTQGRAWPEDRIRSLRCQSHSTPAFLPLRAILPAPPQHAMTVCRERAEKRENRAKAERKPSNKAGRVAAGRRHISLSDSADSAALAPAATTMASTPIVEARTRTGSHHGHHRDAHDAHPIVQHTACYCTFGGLVAEAELQSECVSLLLCYQHTISTALRYALRQDEIDSMNRNRGVLMRRDLGPLPSIRNYHDGL